MSKKRILPPDRLAECAAAHELFLAKKNQLKLSQKKVAEMAGITPAAVNLYFKGINPLNAQFAAVLSRAIEEPVEKFSPRLAKEIAEMASTVQSEAQQRFEGSARSYQGDRYKAAPPDQQADVDEVADMMLRLSPEQARKLKQAMDLLMPHDGPTKD